MQVAILGAAGGIGQPLSLLMTTNPLVSELAIYDIANTPGVAADLGHINVAPSIKGYAGAEQLGECLKGAKLVIIPAGVPRKVRIRTRCTSERSIVRSSLLLAPRLTPPVPPGALHLLPPTKTLAGHDARRSVQHQCGHCQDAG